MGGVSAVLLDSEEEDHFVYCSQPSDGERADVRTYNIQVCVVSMVTGV